MHQKMPKKIHVTSDAPLNFLWNFLADHINETNRYDKKHSILHIPSLWGSLQMVNSAEKKLLAFSIRNK